MFLLAEVKERISQLGTTKATVEIEVEILEDFCDQMPLEVGTRICARYVDDGKGGHKWVLEACSVEGDEPVMGISEAA